MLGKEDAAQWYRMKFGMEETGSGSAVGTALTTEIQYQQQLSDLKDFESQQCLDDA